ncbi:MAG TPA: hypothetical protein VF519_15250 [Mycobacteriales bacterium]|jgi:hypothetical protein
MPLDDEQTEFLRGLGPLPGLTVDETVALVTTYIENQPTAEGVALFKRLVADRTANLLLLGTQLGEFLQWQRQRGGQPDAGVETHPDLADLERLVRDFERVPDVARLHRFTQASLLGAIQRAADAATSADEFRLLADAYLTLPAPGDDDDG